MKFIKIFLSIVLILVVIFVLIGVFIPSFSYKNKVSVKASLNKTFAMFNDETRMGEWLTGFRSIETISGNRNEVGSKYRLVVFGHDEEIVMTEEMTAFKENELFAFNLDNDVMLADVEIKFSGDSTRSEIRANTVVHGKNMFWKSLLPLFKSNMTKQSQTDYEKLKTIIETDN